ncbi:2-hydroxyacid dehydrogenase [Sphingomonas baiyangensis]|uniref:2-hydroxyacid dehydrogenase n=1 Tax=Sphingomonas baiyangensis TaxID=2572576 RepID=A0A4U1L4T6_9SPHN|nr:2-hydroxyacid dehydrogenase [Sphingomonas baiyangensis]TKD51195.1 2-hydroxyacid dehydrogenase [Sphingomonas baiyangensis]
MTVALQLCPLSDALEAQLAERLEIVRWFDLDKGAQQRLLADRAAEIGVVVTGGHLGCDNALVDALPALGLIAINGVGFDKVDLAHAAERRVAVSNTPDVLTDDVADLAVGLVIGLLRNLHGADRFVRAGEWSAGNLALARKVSGRRFGIVGLGRIGTAIAERLQAFGPVAYTGTAPKEVAWPFHADAQALARASDVLVIACAATPDTRHLIDAHVLDALGADGYLVNVARGSVVDEAALVAAIEQGRIAGAALDVFADEPHVPPALIQSDRTLLAPHIASATHETRGAMADLVLANVDAFLAGAALPTPVRA